MFKTILNKLKSETAKKIWITLLFVGCVNIAFYFMGSKYIEYRQQQKISENYDEFGIPRNQNEAVYLNIRSRLINHLEYTQNQNKALDPKKIQMLKHIEQNILKNKYDDWQKYTQSSEAD